MKHFFLIFLFSFQLMAESIDLSNAMTSVKFQGQRNTCSAFAATALMEFLIKNQTGEELDLSEANAYWSGRAFGLDNLPAKDAFLKKDYLGIDGLAGYIAVEGYRYQSVLEEDWPYENQNYLQLNDSRCDQKNPTNICFVGERPASIQVLPYRLEPIFVDRDRMGEFILKNKTPVVFNIKWYPGAIDNNSGHISMPSKSDLKAPSFGHVILLTGYDSDKKLFNYRNSWGTNWGNGGYGTVSEQFLINHCEMCEFKQGKDKNLSSYKFFQGVSGKLIK